MADAVGPPAHDLAVVELLGALTYGQLRAFEVTARAIRVAPDARTAAEVADFAGLEHAAYRSLRDLLASRTDLASGLMDRQKPHFDAYFDAVRMETWVDACTFFAFGLPLAADFVRAIAPRMDPASADVVVSALAGRDAFEATASDVVRRSIAADDEAREDVRHQVADLLGRVLTGFQGALAETDALEVLLRFDAPEDATIERAVRLLAVRMLDGHRRRMHAIGIEDLD